ncbi:GNAT family N-acetyltransferase [Janthinobacterium sp.]|uniref:GNAT family N-acetyltransferase n=1 Tax=Janthinobacterium sp. TaxID=1871054 RepID=UPI0028A01D01|nr:GNAT family N-acetyltransferase [Janthinobacterium sp.]
MQIDKHPPGHSAGEADEISTRLATPADVAAMLACDACWQSHAQRGECVRTAIGKGLCTIALRGGQVAGYVVLQDDFFGHDFVSLVVVSPLHRRRGIGLRLLAAAAACSRARLFTSTNQSNLAARAMIARAGFAPSGQIDNLDEGDPELVFVIWRR